MSGDGWDIFPDQCPMFDGSCATTELAASADGPVGGECGCGWAWGTYIEPEAKP